MHLPEVTYFCECLSNNMPTASTYLGNGLSIITNHIHKYMLDFLIDVAKCLKGHSGSITVHPFLTPDDSVFTLIF